MRAFSTYSPFAVLNTRPSTVPAEAPSAAAAEYGPNAKTNAKNETSRRVWEKGNGRRAVVRIIDGVEFANVQIGAMRRGDDSKSIIAISIPATAAAFRIHRVFLARFFSFACGRILAAIAMNRNCEPAHDLG